MYGMFVNFRGDQIFMDFIEFLSMIVYEVLYAWCLIYNICHYLQCLVFRY